MIKNPFVTNTKRGCEWPKGHPDEVGFHFCGEEVLPGKPYCLKHCGLAYNNKD